MRNRFLITAAVCAMFASQAALADTIVWEDPVHGFTMSYPDSWRVQTPDTSDTRLRVAGPYAEDLAVCSMRVVKDGRIKIYPKDLTDEAVSHQLNRDFWEGEVAKYPQVQMSDFYDPAGLGNKGDATGVRVSYVRDDGNKHTVPMYAVMLGSIYGDKRYVASCTSTAAAYEKWGDVFASILDSVQLESQYHPFATGYYRDFLADPKLNLPRTKPGTVNVKNRMSWWDRLWVDKYHR